MGASESGTHGSDAGQPSLETRADVVKRALEAFARGDIETLLAEADDDVTLKPLITVWRREYRGHAGIREWYGDVNELWEEFGLSADAFEELDPSTLLVNVTWSGRAKGASALLDGPGFAVIGFRGEKVTDIALYMDEASARRAAPGPNRES